MVVALVGDRGSWIRQGTCKRMYCRGVQEERQENLGAEEDTGRPGAFPAVDKETVVEGPMEENTGELRVPTGMDFVADETSEEFEFVGQWTASWNRW